MDIHLKATFTRIEQIDLKLDESPVRETVIPSFGPAEFTMDPDCAFARRLLADIEAKLPSDIPKASKDWLVGLRDGILSETMVFTADGVEHDGDYVDITGNIETSFDRGFPVTFPEDDR